MDKLDIPDPSSLEVKAVWQNLAEAHRYLAELKGLCESLPNRAILLDTLAIQEAKDSSEIENIVGVKDSSGDFTLTGEYIRKTRGKEFSVLCGRDTLIHACLCYGGHGAITACANIAPRLMADIYDKYVAGDVAGSLEAQFLSAPIRMAFNLGSFPTVLKESLQLLGIDAGPSFAPVGTMSTENKELLKKALKEGGVLA